MTPAQTTTRRRTPCSRAWVAHARERGLEVALDLDPRLARREFKRRYPTEQQRVVYVERCPLEQGTAQFRVEPETWHDHMTGNGTPYQVEDGRCVGAVAWQVNGEGGVVAGSRRDVSADLVVEESGPEKVEGRLEGVGDGDEVTVLVEFELFTPDVFSPHLLAYQRELLTAYADLPLKGVIKDEWGFPPTRPSMVEHRSFWYSRGYDQAYRQDGAGRPLLEDLLLMAVAEEGREAERLAAINRYMLLNLRRQAEIEDDYYAAARLQAKGSYGKPGTVVGAMAANGIAKGARPYLSNSTEASSLSIPSSRSRRPKGSVRAAGLPRLVMTDTLPASALRTSSLERIRRSRTENTSTSCLGISGSRLQCHNETQHTRSSLSMAWRRSSGQTLSPQLRPEVEPVE